MTAIDFLNQALHKCDQLENGEVNSSIAGDISDCIDKAKALITVEAGAESSRDFFQKIVAELGFADALPNQMSNGDYWMCTCTAMEKYARHILERIERPAPPPQAGAEDAEDLLGRLRFLDRHTYLGDNKFSDTGAFYDGEDYDKLVALIHDHARHIAAKAVEDRVCRGSCGCPDCHVLADKAGYVPVPDTAGVVETENLLGEIGDHIDDFIDNKTSRNETANFIVETAKRYSYNQAKKAEKAERVLRDHGFVRCDSPACNCGSWHHRFGLAERWEEINAMLSDAGVLDNSTGNLPLFGVRKLINQRDSAVEDRDKELTRLVDEEIELQTKVFNSRNTPMEMRINAQTKLAGLKFVRTWLNPTV